MKIWRFVDLARVGHDNGFELSLIAGTWNKPLEVSPHLPKQVPNTLMPQLIREGIAFANARKNVKATHVKHSPKQPTGNTLSIRKRITSEGRSLRTPFAISLLFGLIGCASQTPVIPTSTKPPVAKIEPLGEVDHDRAIVVMQERMKSAGYQLSSLARDQWNATHPSGYNVTLTVNASNVVVTVYDAVNASLSPTMVSHGIISLLDVATLPTPAVNLAINCKVTSGSGLKLRSETAAVVAYAKAGDVIQNCEQITTNIPLAYAKNKTLSTHIWGQGLYNTQPVLFAWKYVKPEGSE